jgi:hypothetical protein
MFGRCKFKLSTKWLAMGRIAVARRLGDIQTAEILQQTLNEEGEANKMLTRSQKARLPSPLPPEHD